MNFQTYQSEAQAREAGCFNCGDPLEERITESGYPTGRYSIRCGGCGLHNFFDIALPENWPFPVSV